jgi:hypothetical protein
MTNLSPVSWAPFATELAWSAPDMADKTRWCRRLSDAARKAIVHGARSLDAATDDWESVRSAFDVDELREEVIAWSDALAKGRGFVLVGVSRLTG